MSGNRYTHGHHESVLRSHRWRTAENSAGYLLPHLHPGDRVLDIGCGPGTITVDLGARVAPGAVLGIDPSAAVIEQARTGAITAGRASVAFAIGDVFGLDVLPAGAPHPPFDVVHAHQVLQHLSDPVGALAAMRRACRTGGLVAARDADYAGMSWYPQLPLLDRWLTLYRAAARGNGGEPDAGRRLLGWARAAGFPEITVSASVWCFATDADRRWWGGLWADRVQHSALARQLVDSGMADTATLAAIGRAWLEWAADPDGYFLVPHCEILCRA